MEKLRLALKCYPLMTKEGEIGMDRSTAKDTFKKTRRPMGVYRISNSRDERVFVGFSTNLPARLNRHKAELKFGSHRNLELQTLWNSHGESVFEFEVLELLDHQDIAGTRPEEELRLLAQMWIKKLVAAGKSVVFLKS